MHLGHHIRDAHTRQSTFSSKDFVKNKTKRTKRKFYKPVPRMLDLAECWEPRVFLI